MQQDPLDLIPAKPAGDDFEQFFWGLLRRKYPQRDLVYIPAQMGGDYGIEGFSADGIAYQCYADQDSLTLRARTDKQKKKLYDDTTKLKNKSAEIKALLGGLVLSHYFLCVPQYHAAELVAYAETRAKAVRDFGLEWIAPDFAIRIKTPEDYPAEMRAALLDGAAKATLPTLSVSSDDAFDFSADEPELVSTLDAKLLQVKASHPGADLPALREQFIRSFLSKEQMLVHLQEWPETLESIEIQRQLRQEMLETESALGLDPPQLLLRTTLQDYARQLDESCFGITSVDAQRLARGQTGDWLMRCPLRFQDNQ